MTLQIFPYGELPAIYCIAKSGNSWIINHNKRYRHANGVSLPVSITKFLQESFRVTSLSDGPILCPYDDRSTRLKILKCWSSLFVVIGCLQSNRNP
jgi:hypothetical protein